MFDGSQQAPTGVICLTMTGLLVLQALNSCVKAMDNNQDLETLCEHDREEHTCYI